MAVTTMARNTAPGFFRSSLIRGFYRRKGNCGKTNPRCDFRTHAHCGIEITFASGYQSTTSTNGTPRVAAAVESLCAIASALASKAKEEMSLGELTRGEPYRYIISASSFCRAG